MAHGIDKVYHTEIFLESSLDSLFIRSFSLSATAKNHSLSLSLLTHTHVHTHTCTHTVPYLPATPLSLPFLLHHWLSPLWPVTLTAFQSPLGSIPLHPSLIPLLLWEADAWNSDGPIHSPLRYLLSHDGHPCQDQYHVLSHICFLFFRFYS